MIFSDECRQSADCIAYLPINKKFLSISIMIAAIFFHYLQIIPIHAS